MIRRSRPPDRTYLYRGYRRFVGTKGPSIIAVEQVVETDTAQPITVLKSKAIGRVTETDTSQAISARKTKEIGQVTETDTAQAASPGRVQASSYCGLLRAGGLGCRNRDGQRRQCQPSPSLDARARYFGANAAPAGGHAGPDSGNVPGLHSGTARARGAGIARDPNRDSPRECSDQDQLAGSSLGGVCHLVT